MIKQSVARRLPVYMQDNAGAPVLGLAWGDVAVHYTKEGDNSLSEKTLVESPVEWFEIGQGLYKILFTDAELDTVGFFEYFVTGGSALQYPGLVQISARLVDDIVKDVWDELITPAYHNIKNSAGRSLFKIPAIIVHSGTAEGPGTGNNQIELDEDASAVNSAYRPGLIYILEGTGAGQSRLIINYDGSTKMCTVDRNWEINPDDTSEFVIAADAGREHTCEGLASAATANTITLCNTAPAIDDYYKNHLVFIRSGTGHGQARLIASYVGSTKVATLRRNWSTTPDTTSGYVVLPMDFMSELITEINANETKLDTAITDIGLNKTELDTLILRKDHNMTGD